LISNNGLNCLNNTFSSNRIIHFEGNDVKNNQISSASFFNVLANNLEENTLSSISNMIMNGNECYLNNARNVKCGNCFANVIENNNFVTITNLNQTANKIDSNLYSYVSTLTIDAASIRGNYVNGENIDVSGSYITKNTFSGFQNAIINVNSVFSSNSIGNGTYFNLNNYNTSVNVSGNSFYVDELKMNRIYTDYFTKNTISVNKMLDFDYGSSNVYDNELNYLLSDYIDESKVLGKYNLVPYVRSLMNGGGNGNVSICAFAKNLRNQIILFPDNIDTFNLNINFSNTDTGPLLDGITFSNKTINKFLVNNWNLTSGGLRSIMSMKNVSINSFWYDADWNAYIHTGSLFSCSTSNGLTINEVNYTHNTHYTSSMDTINEIYPICSNATFGTVNMSFFQNQFAYAPIYNNTIKQLNMSGSTPVLAGLKCSISTFNYKDFINSTHIDSTNPPFKSCTFGNILFSPDSTISTSRIFNQCSIKNANVVCTPLMWDMSSATYRAWMAEAIAGFNNTTTDVVPMSYVSVWPN
jgi:hypothetical protein